MSVIRSSANRKVKDLRRLRTRKGRRDFGLTLVEGPTLVGGLASSSQRPDHLVVAEDDEVGLALAADFGSPVVMVDAAVLSSIGDTKETRSPIAVVAIPQPKDVRVHDQVVLHDIADPGNAGTIIRTAAAFGFDVTVIGRTADVWSPKVIRASAGAVFDVRLATCESLDALSEALEGTDATVLATTVRGGTPVPDVPRATGSPPVAITLGSEAHGLPEGFVRSAGEVITIPMASSTESLNVAVAAGIILHAMRRR